jgi:hypothetical protein
MELPDPVLVFLQSQGCAPAVAEAGLPGLVAAWERIVQAVADGYPGGLEDYLRDMDTRALLDEAWQSARTDQQESSLDRLQAADRRMRALVVPTGGCLSGDVKAEREGWSPDLHWWYFSRPAVAGPRFRSRLEGDDGPGADQ